jgi:hypothetical protein
MPDARLLLRLLACFADSPIPYDLLLRPEILAEQAPWGATGSQLWRLLQALAGLGLVDLREPADPEAGHPGRYTAGLHPLVRDTSAAHPDVAGDPAGFPALAARLVAAAADSDDTRPPEDPATWPAWQTLAPHAAYTLRQVSASADRLPKQTVEQACHAAHMAGRYLHARGLYRPAEGGARPVAAGPRRRAPQHPGHSAQPRRVAARPGRVGRGGGRAPSSARHPAAGARRGAPRHPCSPGTISPGCFTPGAIWARRRPSSGRCSASGGGC